MAAEAKEKVEEKVETKLENKTEEKSEFPIESTESLKGSEKEKKEKPHINEPLQVMVRNNDKVLFEGKAKSITTYNEFGDFDVLPGHTEFISLIYDKLKIKTEEGEDKDIEIATGIIRIYKNQVDIFLGLDAVSIDAPVKS